jgi:PAS domain S-box-containing protein
MLYRKMLRGGLGLARIYRNFELFLRVPLLAGADSYVGPRLIAGTHYLQKQHGLSKQHWNRDTQPMTATINALMVEDNLADARFIELLLAQRNDAPVVFTRAATAVEAQVALAAVRSGGFDVVLLDMGLPGVESQDAVRWMQQLAPMLPIVVLSGRDDEAVAIKAVRDGAQDYLVKGRIDAEVLLRSLRYAIERKKTQSALLESESRFASFMNNSPAIAFMKDSQGRYIYANPLFERTLGLSPNEWRDKRDDELLPAAAAEPLKANDAAVLVGGRSIEINEVVPGVGGARDWLTFKFPFTTAAGERHLAGMAVDITLRVRAEEALHQAEAARLEAVQLQSNTLNALPALVALLDARANISVMNEAWRSMLSHHADHPFKASSHHNYLELITDFLSPADCAQIGESLTAVLNGTASRISQEYPLITGMPPRWHNIVLAAIPWHEGRRVVVMHIDTTDRHTAETLLAQSQARYKRVVETAQEGIWVTDVQGNAALVNHRAAVLLGITQAELIGRKLTDFTLGQSTAVNQAHVQRIQAGGAASYEVKLRSADGHERWVSVCANALYDDAGRYEGMLKMITDITERKRAEAALQEAEEQLRQAQKMEAVGQLAGGVAHDFNNLLTAIRGFASLARKTLSAEHPAFESLRHVEDAANQASGVAAALQTFARKKNAESLPIRLSATVEEAARLFRRTLAPGVRLHVEASSNQNIWVRGDDTQLFQVITNLALNARDAVGATGNITISLHPSEGPTRRQIGTPQGGASGRKPAWCAISVKDDGCGMTPAVAERVFEPFFTTKSRGQGTGLGLSVIHGIVLEHGGCIEVESAPGAGAAFYAFLPCIEPLIPSLNDHDDPVMPLNTMPQGPVLLVQNSPMVRGVVASMLSALDYDVVNASNFQDALAVVRSELENDGRRIGILICDQHLVDGEGLDLFGLLRSHLPEIACILVGDDAHTLVSIEGSGRVTALKKPFRIADVEACLRSLARPAPAAVSSEGSPEITA